MPFPIAACRGKIQRLRPTGFIDINNETGNTSQYSGTSGKVSVGSGAPAMNGSLYGLDVNIDDTTIDYAAMTGLNVALTQQRGRFWFNPNSLTMANGNNFSIARTYRTVDYLSQIDINFSYTTTGGAHYALKFYYRNDAGLQAGTFVTLPNNPAYLEWWSQKASSNVASDGQFHSWLNGTPVDSITLIDAFDNWGNCWGIRLGDVTAPQTGVAGHLYFDELVVNSTGDPIGP
jgi:hypothetical protein